MLITSLMKTKTIWFIIAASMVNEIGSTDCCPDGWISYRSHCYYIGHDKRTFMEAEHFCSYHDAYLVRIDGYYENKFLKELLRNLKVSSTWTGLNDQRSEGIWRWIGTNEHASFSDWGPGEPNNLNNEDCVGLWTHFNYRWNDCKCLTKLRPLCEKS